MKKILVLILALILGIGVLAGCQQEPVEITQSTTETALPTETTQSTETAGPEPTEYRFQIGAVLDVYSGHASALDGTMLNDFIEEATGLDIVWKTYPDEGISCVYINPTPSLVFTTKPAYSSESGYYWEYVNLWDYQDIMPNFFAYFNSPEYAAYKAVFMLSENELYAAPVYLNGSVQYAGWIYREDIFRELELELPTDWDSFYAVLKALKAAYPDSYPFTMRNMIDFSAFTDFAQQFGVKYSDSGCVLDDATGKYYDPHTADSMREMLKKLDLLMDEGLMSRDCLKYDTAAWQEAMATGQSFITHDKALQLERVEAAAQSVNPEITMNWFNNIPLAESDLPYTARIEEVKDFCWYVTTKCADVELALRYLDWMYSEEGVRILSWGVEGKSYGVDENGNKYFLEGYDHTYQARYQESGYLDFAATLAGYTEKTQEMILGTVKSAEEGGFKPDPKLVFQGEERSVIEDYQQVWINESVCWLQDFLAGRKDIHSDKDWEAFKAVSPEMCVNLIMEAYDSAYARYLNGE